MLICYHEAREPVSLFPQQSHPIPYLKELPGKCTCAKEKESKYVHLTCSHQFLAHKSHMSITRLCCYRYSLRSSSCWSLWSLCNISEQRHVTEVVLWMSHVLKLLHGGLNTGSKSTYCSLILMLRLFTH